MLFIELTPTSGILIPTALTIRKVTSHSIIHCLARKQDLSNNNIIMITQEGK
jgi:hypothetical protein